MLAWGASGRRFKSCRPHLLHGGRRPAVAPELQGGKATGRGESLAGFAPREGIKTYTTGFAPREGIKTYTTGFAPRAHYGAAGQASKGTQQEGVHGQTIPHERPP